jgi:hypothetical protein
LFRRFCFKPQLLAALWQSMLRYEHGLKISGWARKEKYHCDEWCVASRETLEVRTNGADWPPDGAAGTWKRRGASAWRAVR